MAVPGYPTEIQGLDFLGAPLIAPLDATGQGHLVTAGDSSAIEGSATGGGTANVGAGVAVGLVKITDQALVSPNVVLSVSGLSLSAGMTPPAGGGTATAGE